MISTSLQDVHGGNDDVTRKLEHWDRRRSKLYQSVSVKNLAWVDTCTLLLNILQVFQPLTHLHEEAGFPTARRVYVS